MQTVPRDEISADVGEDGRRHELMQRYGCLLREGNDGWLDDVTLEAGVNLATTGFNVAITSPLIWRYFEVNNYEDGLKLVPQPVRRHPEGFTHILPVHLNGNHWALVVCDETKEYAGYMDPMKVGENGSTEKAYVQEGIRRWIEASVGTPRLLIARTDITVQSDGFNCGISKSLFSFYRQR